MIKKSLAWGLILVFIFSILLSGISLVSGADDKSFVYDIPVLGTFLTSWVDGYGENGLTGETTKYLVLILIIILIYTALSYASFPENSGVRWIISIIVGFLATFLITTPELLAMLQSYTALGVALIVFFPIVILLFFTLAVARKSQPMGIFTQRIVWVIYGAYLGIKTVILLVIQWNVNHGVPINDLLGITPGQQGSAILRFFIGGGESSIKTLESIAGASDSILLIVQVIVAVAVIVIMGFMNKGVLAWMAQEIRDSEAESQKAKIARSNAYDKARSEAMQNQ